MLEGGNVYEYQLRVTYEDGLEIRGPRRAFGVDRGTSIAMTMTGDSFEAGRATLTPQAVQALAELAKALTVLPCLSLKVAASVSPGGSGTEQENRPVESTGTERSPIRAEAWPR